MSSNKFSYPYPILGNFDDIQSELAEDCVKAEMTSDSDSHYYHFVLDIEDETILDLIAQHKAKYAVTVKCKNTLYQDRVSSDSKEIVVKIPRTSAVGRVDFQLFVIATEPFVYFNPKENPIFMGSSFDINPGDPLVFFPDQYDYLDVTFHMLKHYSSILVPVSDENVEDDDMQIKVDEKIEVHLSPDTFGKFKEVNTEQNSQEIMASIVQSALTAALFNLFLGGEDYEIEGPDDIRRIDKAWIEAIVKRIDNEEGMPSLEDVLESPITEIPSLVQKLLQNPIASLLEKLGNQMSSTQETTEETLDF